jgi:hypothetical protein
VAKSEWDGLLSREERVAKFDRDGWLRSRAMGS